MTEEREERRANKVKKRNGQERGGDNKSDTRKKGNKKRKGKERKGDNERKRKETRKEEEQAVSLCYNRWGLAPPSVSGYQATRDCH